MRDRLLSRSALAFYLASAGIGPAFAQGASPPSGSPRDPYITSTGETVDKPGQSQGAGTTQLDRNIQRENNRIDGSICKGC